MRHDLRNPYCLSLALIVLLAAVAVAGPVLGSSPHGPVNSSALTPDASPPQDPDNQPPDLRPYGDAGLHLSGELDPEGMHEQLKGLLGEDISPALIAALLERNWSAVQSELTPQLTTRLIELGLEEGEAKHLIEQDWNALGSTSRNNLTSVLARELDVNPRLISSLIAGDWEGFTAWLEVEAINRDIIGEASSMTSGLLNPSQVAALIRGEWGIVLPGLEEELLGRLNPPGLSPEETALILGQDWSALLDRQKEELQTIAVSNLNLPPSLVEAAVQRDWEHLSAAAQVYMVQYLIEMMTEPSSRQM